MNTEKTVRKQAKKVLEGNRSVIISEVMVAVLAFLTGLFAFSLAMSVAGLYAVKNPNQTQQMLTMIFGLVFFAFVVVCLPLINGVYRSVCNAVRGRECSPLDVFYYYKKPKLFFKSVILDVISVGLFFIISGLLNVFNYLSAVSDKIIDNSPSLTAVVAVLLVLAFIVSTAVVVVCYIIFVHYTFLAYGFNARSLYSENDGFFNKELHLHNKAVYRLYRLGGFVLFCCSGILCRTLFSDSLCNVCKMVVRA